MITDTYNEIINLIKNNQKAEARKQLYIALAKSDPAVIFHAEELVAKSSLRKVLPKINKKETLAVAVLTKNESSNLKRLLKNITPLADELVILDTGSTDNTVTLAQALGAKVYHYHWQHNFAAARNELLKRCQSTWILMLDADETISYRDQLKIAALLSDKKIAAYSLSLRVYATASSHPDFFPKQNNDNYFETVGYSGWLGGFVTKLFQRKQEYYYQFSVHESILETIKANSGIVMELPIVIHNFGYKKGQKRKNQAYYFKLIEKELKSGNCNSRNLLYAAQFYLSQNKLEKSEYLLKSAAAKDKANELILVHLAKCYYLLKKYSLAYRSYLKIKKKLPPNQQFFYALSCLRIQKVLEAKKVLNELNFYYGSQNTEVLFQLAYIEFIQNRPEEAKLILRKILEIDPFFTAAQQKLSLIEGSIK